MAIEFFTKQNEQCSAICEGGIEASVSKESSFSMALGVNFSGRGLYTLIIVSEVRPIVLAVRPMSRRARIYMPGVLDFEFFKSFTNLR